MHLLGALIEHVAKDTVESTSSSISLPLVKIGQFQCNAFPIEVWDFVKAACSIIKMFPLSNNSTIRDTIKQTIRNKFFGDVERADNDTISVTGPTVPRYTH